MTSKWILTAALGVALLTGCPDKPAETPAAPDTAAPAGTDAPAGADAPADKTDAKDAADPPASQPAGE